MDEMKTELQKVRMPFGAFLSFCALTFFSLVAIGGVHTFVERIAPSITVDAYPDFCRMSIALCINLSFLILAIYHPVRIWKRSMDAINICPYTVMIGSVLVVITTSTNGLATFIVYGVILGLTYFTVAYVNKSKKIEQWMAYKASVDDEHNASDTSKDGCSLLRTDSMTVQAAEHNLTGATEAGLQEDMDSSGSKIRKRSGLVVRGWRWIMQPRLSYPIFIIGIVLVAYFFFAYDSCGNNCFCYSSRRLSRSVCEGIIIGRLVSVLVLIIAFISFGKRRSGRDSTRDGDKNDDQVIT